MDDDERSCLTVAERSESSPRSITTHALHVNCVSLSARPEPPELSEPMANSTFLHAIRTATENSRAGLPTGWKPLPRAAALKSTGTKFPVRKRLPCGRACRSLPTKAAYYFAVCPTGFRDLPSSCLRLAVAFPRRPHGRMDVDTLIAKDMPAKLAWQVSGW